MGLPVLRMGVVFVFGCVLLYEHVSVSDSMCCLRCVVGYRRCVGCSAVVTDGSK